MRNSLTALVLVGLLFAVPAVAAEVPRGDAKFIKEAAEGNLAEVKLGELAQQRAASDAVKEFGKRMATDHQKALDELSQVASQKGVAMPTALDRSHQRFYDKLAKLSGADFDRAYMKEMVRDHDKDVKAFQKEANAGKDPDVKAWAGKTLPTLQEHQQQAKQAYASVQGKGKGSPSASPSQK
jgi:putative membrane protein